MSTFIIRGQFLLRYGVMALLVMIGTGFMFHERVMAQADNPGPPDKAVKLIFIHHSCGENWLADGHGRLGMTLGKNKYFVSDTNYGWGPDSIGDRTDITNWPEWFTGPRSRIYLKALYREQGKHSPYTRTMSDPGGENQIIMFKSCFPNSNLEGKPGDQPRRGHGLTVSNAKAIYNELLGYFATRPDKLFIAITAPPVQDRTHAANARAFNTWLVRDWLAQYRGKNVAVFDFYNVLTGPKNHHTFQNGKIQYVTNRGRNTLHYPTNGDDHPSPAGNRKATNECVHLLNVYYHRWQGSAPIVSRVEPPPKAEAMPERPKETLKHEPPPKTASTSAELSEVIDNFEQGYEQWAAFIDQGKNTNLAFECDQAHVHNGRAALRISYDIAPESWAICSLVYQHPRNWQSFEGLTVYLHAERVGQPAIIIAYQGKSSDNLSHFEFRMKTGKDAVTGWQRVDIPWDQFIQAAWEGDGTAKFDPASSMGLAFSFEADESGSHAGKLWVDDVTFLSAKGSAKGK